MPSAILTNIGDRLSHVPPFTQAKTKINALLCFSVH